MGTVTGNYLSIWLADLNRRFRELTPTSLQQCINYPSSDEVLELTTYGKDRSRSLELAGPMLDFLSRPTPLPHNPEKCPNKP